MADSVQIVMNFGGGAIPGLSALDNYPNWIVLGGLGFSGSFPTTARDGTKEAPIKGNASITTISMWRAYDASTNPIFQQFSTRAKQSNAIIAILSGSGGDDELLRITITDPTIYGWQRMIGGDSGLEAFNVGGTQMTLKSAGYNSQGTIDDNITVPFSWQKLKSQ